MLASGRSAVAWRGAPTEHREQVTDRDEGGNPRRRHAADSAIGQLHCLPLRRSHLGGRSIDGMHEALGGGTEGVAVAKEQEEGGGQEECAHAS